jgi:hypothetical protein
MRAPRARRSELATPASSERRCATRRARGRTWSSSTSRTPARPWPRKRDGRLVDAADMRLAENTLYKAALAREERDEKGDAR